MRCARDITKFRGARLALLLALVLGATKVHAEPARHGGDDDSGRTIGEVVDVAQAKAPGSRDALFDDDTKPAEKEADVLSGWHGFVRTELAHTYASPAHWSQFLTRAQVEAQGSLGDQLKWKASARLDYNPVFDLTHFYPPDVGRNQRVNVLLRENYLDVDAGDWDFRLGRQHIVWGEMVGLFFADVVSAKDLREFILPDFDVLRIPQWAARAEYFKNDIHAELLWIPVQSYNEIGKPGAEFYPAVPPPPPGFATLYGNEQFPSRTLGHTDYGARVSALRAGWDVAAFYYGSMDAAATFYRDIVTSQQPAFVYEARHDRIDQVGATLAKDLGFGVLKAETVYTRGRRFNVIRLADPDGVVPQNTLDWIVGLDLSPTTDTRVNFQLFQRLFFDHDPDLVYGPHDCGFSILINQKLTERFEAEALWVGSLNRTDWMFRPRVAWNIENNWRLLVGVDVFKGPQLGYFGQYDNRDRVYAELRYSF